MTGDDGQQDDREFAESHASLAGPHVEGHHPPSPEFLESIDHEGLAPACLP
jgi:hypothetical protein